MERPDLRQILARSTGLREAPPPSWEEAFRGHLLARTHESVRVAAGVVAAVMLVSVLLRHGLIEDVLLSTSVANLILVALAALLAGLARGAPSRRLTPWLAGALILAAVVECGAVIHLGGGLASTSWPSLLLVLMGVPLLFPLRVRGMLGVTGAVWLVFGAAAWTGTQAPGGLPAGVLADRVLWLALGSLVGLAASRVTLRLTEADFYSRMALQEEQERTEQLLLNVLPSSIAERLKQGEESIAEAFEEVTVLFADIVGFTPLSSGRSPGEVVGLLDDLFSRFDRLVIEHGLEKIKTIGDCYMVAGGIPLPRVDHAEAVARMALAMLATLEDFDREHGVDLSVRIGLHSGPVVAGVIGRSKFAYDLWGDTVNTASRMESHGVPGRVQVTEDAHRRLEGRFRFEERGSIEVKGKGQLRTFLLEGSKEEVDEGPAEGAAG